MDRRSWGPRRGATSAAALAVAVGWVTTGWVTLLLVRVPSRGLCDGTWFLAPAAPLAGAIGLVVLTPGAPAPFARLLWVLAAVACSVGVLGYLLVVVLALLRVRRHGMAGAPPVCWWVGTGCGGLAAATTVVFWVVTTWLALWVRVRRSAG